MDLVYICRDGDNEELRYSIRSAVKNLKHDNLWVIGGKPDWYTGKYIPVPQTHAKYENAKENIRAAINSPDISDDFIIMNDDFFILSRVSRLGRYYGGSLRSRVKELKSRYGSSTYTTLLNESLKYLSRHGIPNPKDYALHVPVSVNKQKLLSILDLDLSWRTLYGNLYGKNSQQVLASPGTTSDVKVYVKNENLERPAKNSLTSKFLSSQDNSFEFLLPMLQKKFPDPSPFESLYPQSDSNRH